MKALVYKGLGQKSWEDVPDPKILQSTDVIVKMDATTICSTDLHILKGDVPEVEVGRILGHEGIGDLTEIGSGVIRLWAPGVRRVSVGRAGGPVVSSSQGVGSELSDAPCEGVRYDENQS